MDWTTIFAPEYGPEGSLRDIYILNTTLEDWARVWKLLLTVADNLTFAVDGEPTATPPTVEEAFRLTAFSSVNATYSLGKQRINCHFFIMDEVEFDLDPRDVDGPLEAGRLGCFLAALGQATAKEVRLTPEGEPEVVIARYDPVTCKVVWTSRTL